MIPRLIQESIEDKILSIYAIKSKDTKGRERQEERCSIRTDFQRDRDRILHSKAFRRLKQKTQVFISPEGDHYRTRLTHTLEVSQIARTISRALSLNEDLTEAIALGHDLGHTPFGHGGEKILNVLCPGGFEHSQQSLRIVERLEKNGQGLNLTWEVRDGILNHRSKGKPHTMEGKVVQLSDKIAYINHDIDDAERAGVLTEDNIPEDVAILLGRRSSQRINTLISSTIENSQGIGTVKMGKEIKEAMARLRSFMFNHVYVSERFERDLVKIENVITALYQYYKTNPQQMHEEFTQLLNAGEKLEVVVCDYIAGMTDRYAINKYSELFVPESWNVF